MKHIDTIIQFESDSADKIAGRFTVDNTTDYVELAYHSIGDDDPYNYHLSNATAAQNLASYDRFLIISIGMNLPLDFGLWEEGIKLDFGYLDSEGGNSGFEGLGDYGRIILPFANYEYPIDLSYDPQDLDMQAPRKIGALATNLLDDPLKISMLNVPDALNGKVFYCPIWMKIAHNTLLT